MCESFKTGKQQAIWAFEKVWFRAGIRNKELPEPATVLLLRPSFCARQPGQMELCNCNAEPYCFLYTDFYKLQ